ncbi:MAG: lytic transglycosylase domain-containing protein, partial [Erythrobacter sp.]|nr:lytic transglycosylase domain-containing protein [Erythrobacter sp.]
MSSMGCKLLNTRRMYAAILGASALVAGAFPAAAQDWGSGQDLVARQPGAVDAVIARWETLQASRTHSFADYAGFVLAWPSFPKTDILRLRAEAALENEAPGQAELLRFFDAHPPLTNPARARYALALAAVQRPEALEVARKAWRGGQMADPVELYLSGLYGAQFTPEDHAVRVDALLWQGKADAASRMVVNLPEEARAMALARIALLRGARPESSGITVPPGAEADPGYVFNLVKFLRTSGQNYEAARVFTSRPAFVRPARDPEAFVGQLLDLAEDVGPSEAAQIAARSGDLFAPDAELSETSFTLRDRLTDLMWLGGTKALWSLGDGTTAAPLFARYGDAAKTPLTKSKGYYWAGRAARQAGDQTAAQRYFEMAARWPDYYYGQLSLSAL